MLSTRIGQELYGSALLFEDHERFKEHLDARSENIKGAISDLFERLPSATPDIEDLRRQLAELLANEKEHAIALQTTLVEQESLNTRLEAACIRYMVAEKKLDRVKSAQVQKLESQATMGGNGESASNKKSSSPKKEHEETNGISENGVASAEVESARKMAVAEVEQQRSQLEQIEADNVRLTNELSGARTKLLCLTDEEYSVTSLFKGFKSQYEDIIKRVNDLEATNVKLREEARGLQAERTAYKNHLDEETRNQFMETETQLARAETDLARIRTQRDDLDRQLILRKETESLHRVSVDQATELSEAREQRIASLESQVERLKLQLGEISAKTNGNQYDDMDADTLRQKLRTVENQYTLLSNELPSMEAAWKKAQASASRRIEEIAGSEDQISRSSADKVKAEQKYFAAMKAKDARDSELRLLQSKSSRASEIISQLKDTDGKNRELVVALERQLADSKETSTTLEQQNRSLAQKAKEASIATEGLKKQIDDLKVLIDQKEKGTLAAAKTHRATEVELAKCRSQLEDTKKQFDTLRKNKSTESDNDANDGWRVS